MACRHRSVLDFIAWLRERAGKLTLAALLLPLLPLLSIPTVVIGRSADQIARERDYKNRDVINVSKAGLGDIYEEKIKVRPAADSFSSWCVWLAR